MSVIRVGAVRIAGSLESHNGSGDETALSYTDGDVLDMPLPEHTYQRPLPPPNSVTHINIGYIGLPYQDHNYGMPPPPSPPRPASPRPPSPLQVNGVVQMEEEVKTTPLVSVVEEVVEDSITRCICGYLHDDGYMICCDKCSVWQHIDCMGVDRNNIPESYFCEQCQPRILDAAQAKILQKRKREELAARNVLSDSSATDTDPEEATNALASMGKKLPIGKKKKTTKQKRATKMKEKAQLKLKVGKSVIQKKIKKPGKKEKENIKTTKPRKIFKTAAQKVKAGKTEMGKTPFLCLDQSQSDPWNSTISPWTDEYEFALENHYSLAVSEYSRSSKHLNENINLVSAMIDQLQDQQTCVADVKKNRKGLKTTQDIPAGQAIIDYKGSVFTKEEYDKQHSLVDRFKVLQPFTLFYSKLDVELCVDATAYGNEARFVRRSCFPNAEVQHTVSDGEIMFIIVAKEDIPSQAEVTIPFDYDYKNCSFCVECACIKNNCAVSRYWKKLKNPLKASSKDISVKKRRQSSSDGGRRNSVSSDKDPSSPKLASPTKSSPGKSPQRKLSTTASSPPPKMPQSPMKYSNVSTLLAASALLEGQLDVAKSLNFDVVGALQQSPPPPTSPPLPVFTPKSAASSRRASRATMEETIQEEVAPSKPIKEKVKKEKESKHKEKDNKDHHYHHVEVKRERKNSRRQSQDEVEIAVDTVEPVQPTSESEEAATPTESRKKMTREERKLDAIMKAFEKMEKRQERKKEALAKSDVGVKKGPMDSKFKKGLDGDGVPNPDSAPHSRSASQDEPMEVHADSKPKQDVLSDSKPPSSPEQGDSAPNAGEGGGNSDNDTKIKKEPDTQGGEALSSPASPGPPTESAVTVPQQLSPVKEETKPPLMTPSSNSRPVRRTGKRKRRRSRAQSTTTKTTVVCESASVSTDEGNSNSSVPPTPLSVPSTPTLTPVSTPLPPPTESTDGAEFAFKFKSKKHLFNEWSNKQYDENKEEMFVQCLPSPHVNNMDHLQRRNSHSAGCSKGTESSVGSAKKRWLRQAMHEVPAPVAFRHSLSVSTELEQASISPVPGSASPNPGGQSSPRAGSPLDFVTPLKKRRLMRESLSNEVNGGLASPSAGVLAESLVSNGVAIVPRSNGVKQFFPAHRHSTDDRLLLHKNYPKQNGFTETVLDTKRACPVNSHPELQSMASPLREEEHQSLERCPMSPPTSQSRPAPTMMNGLDSPQLPAIVPTVSVPQSGIKLPLKFRNLFDKTGVGSSESEQKDHRVIQNSQSVLKQENGVASFPSASRQIENSILARNYEKDTNSNSSGVVVVNRSTVFNGVRNFIGETSETAGCVTAKSIMHVDDGPAIVRVDLNAHEMEPSSLSDNATAVVNLSESLFQLNTTSSSSASCTHLKDSPRVVELPGECQVNSSVDVQALIPASEERIQPSVDICDNACTDSSVVQVNMEDNNLLETERLANGICAEEGEDEVVDSSQQVNRSSVTSYSSGDSVEHHSEDRLHSVVSEEDTSHDCAQSSSSIDVLTNKGISSSGQRSVTVPSAPSVCDSMEDIVGTKTETAQPESETMEVDSAPCDSETAMETSNEEESNRRHDVETEEEPACDSAGTSSTDLTRDRDSDLTPQSEDNREDAVSESHQSENFFEGAVNSDGNVDSTCEQPKFAIPSSSLQPDQGSNSLGMVESCCDSNFERRPIWCADSGEQVTNTDDSSLEGQGVSSSNIDCTLGERMDWDSDSCGPGEALSDNAISSASGNLSIRSAQLSSLSPVQQGPQERLNASGGPCETAAGSSIETERSSGFYAVLPSSSDTISTETPASVSVATTLAGAPVSGSTSTSSSYLSSVAVSQPSCSGVCQEAGSSEQSSLSLVCDSAPASSPLASPSVIWGPTTAGPSGPTPNSSSAEAIPAAKKKVSLLEYRKRLKEKPSTNAPETRTSPSPGVTSLSLSPSSSLLMLSPNHNATHSSFSSSSRMSPSSSSFSPSRSHVSVQPNHRRTTMPTLATLPLFKASDHKRDKCTPDKRKQAPKQEKQLSLSERLRLEFGVEDCDDDAGKKKDSVEESEVASTNGNMEEAPPPPPPPSTSTSFKPPGNPLRQAMPLVNGGSGSGFSSSTSYHNPQHQAGISSTSSVGSSLLSRKDRTSGSTGAYTSSLSATNKPSSTSSYGHHQHQGSSSAPTPGTAISHSTTLPGGPSSFHHKRPPSGGSSSGPGSHNSSHQSNSQHGALLLQHPTSSTSTSKQFDINHRTSSTSSFAGGGVEEHPPPPPPPLPNPHHRSSSLSSTSLSHRSGSSSSSSSTLSSHRYNHHHHSHHYHHSSSGKSKSNKAAASSSSRYTDSRSKY